MTSAPAIVVGGGISGVACASALAAAGIPAHLRERAHRLGGRMASRTLRDTGTAFDGRVVDIGASYFTATDPDFAGVVALLQAEGVVRPWTSGFHVAGPEGIEGVSGGAVRYAAPRGLRSVVEVMARDLPAVSLEAPVESVVVDGSHLTIDGLPAAAAALCMPAPQARRICDVLPDDPTTWEPVLAVTCVFERSSWIDIDGVFVNGDPVITWIADDGSRRGDGAPVLVAHVDPVLSARHLGDPATVVPMAVAAIQRVLQVRDYPDWVDVHRWSYAKPLASSPEPFWLDDGTSLGMAGDAFSAGPKVESAWLAGHRLGAALAARLAD